MLYRSIDSLMKEEQPAWIDSALGLSPCHTASAGTAELLSHCLLRQEDSCFNSTQDECLPLLGLGGKEFLPGSEPGSLCLAFGRKVKDRNNFDLIIGKL